MLTVLCVLLRFKISFSGLWLRKVVHHWPKLRLIWLDITCLCLGHLDELHISKQPTLNNNKSTKTIVVVSSITDFIAHQTSTRVYVRGGAI